MIIVIYIIGIIVELILVGQIFFWVIFVGFLVMIVFYFISIEEGVMYIFFGMEVYEFVYDGCYLFGFFCY